MTLTFSYQLLGSVNIPSVLVFLSVAAFNKGVINTSIPASFKSNCCHSKVVFVGLDLVGNMGTCSVSLITDIMSFGTKLNTTAVSLRSGESTQVPFTLTNLGSRGSFSFHVTKTSSLISYVIPFSLALDANASAAGHVVIASRNDTSQLKKLTVTAAALSDTVNIKVTLFQVSVLSETKATSPALKEIRLEAVAPNSHQFIKPGARLEVSFTVMNLAAIETFTFNVSFSWFRWWFFYVIFFLWPHEETIYVLFGGVWRYSYIIRTGVLPPRGTMYLFCGRGLNMSPPHFRVINSYKVRYLLSYNMLVST